MKRILLSVAVLLMVTPALATVTITASEDSDTVIRVSYNCDGGEEVRAFALDVNVGAPMVITDICDFNVGTDNGYGVFPGKFRDHINASDPNWDDPNYNPIAPETDTDAAGTGLGTGKIIAEMGSLYEDPNAPPSSGTLFVVTVDCNGAPGNGLLHLAVNTTRGGVVEEDGSSITPVLVDSLVTCGPPPVCTVPNIINMTEAAALAAIDACDLVPGTRTEGFSDTIPVGSVMAQAPAGGTVVACESAVDYTVVCRRITCGTCIGDVGGDNWVKTGDITDLVTLLAGAPSYRIRNTSCDYNPCGDMQPDAWNKTGDITDLVVYISGLPSFRCRCDVCP